MEVNNGGLWCGHFEPFGRTQALGWLRRHRLMGYTSPQEPVDYRLAILLTSPRAPGNADGAAALAFEGETSRASWWRVA